MKSRLFLTLLIFALATGAYGQPSTQLNESSEAQSDEWTGENDTTLVQTAPFDEATLKRLAADPELNYKQPPTVAESLFTRFLIWLGQLLESLFDGTTSTTVGNVLLYIAIVLVLVVLVMMLLKVDALKVFYRGADEAQKPKGIFHEDIHVMDFEALIAQARANGDYKVGVRLYLLYALKKLSDKHIIEWHSGKTNHDYVEEVKNTSLKTDLNELSFYFDYTWYGGFTIDQPTFQRVEVIFSQFKTQVTQP